LFKNSHRLWKISENRRGDFFDLHCIVSCTGYKLLYMQGSVNVDYVYVKISLCLLYIGSVALVTCSRREKWCRFLEVACLATH